MTKSNTSIIDALNTTVEPELDNIIMNMADMQFGFGSYDKAIAWAATKYTYDDVMRLCDAYKELAQVMKDVAIAIPVTLHT